MKNFIILAIIILLVVTLVTLGVRYFSSVTTSLDVINPKPGIECVLASTADGTALSCNWSQK